MVNVAVNSLVTDIHFYCNFLDSKQKTHLVTVVVKSVTRDILGYITG